MRAFPLTAEAAEAAFPSLSPDGKSVMYTSHAEGGPVLMRKDLDGSGTRPLTDGSQLERYGRWSPDGKWIAQVSGGHGGRHDVGTRVLENCMPQLALAHQLIIGLESIKGNVASFAPVGMAVIAVLGENGLVVHERGAGHRERGLGGGLIPPRAYRVYTLCGAQEQTRHDK